MESLSTQLEQYPRKDLMPNQEQSRATSEQIKKTIANLEERNFHPELLDNKEQALARIQELIPAEADVMTASSLTLDQIGLTDLLISAKHPWNNLKAAIVAESDPAKQGQLRRESVLASYFLGSVHAVTESGQLLIASASGSQIAPYAFTSPNVIWVVGTQKIVKDLDAGMKRINEYVLPLEDARMKSVGYPGSSVNKLLIFEREKMPNRTLRILLVNDVLGF